MKKTLLILAIAIISYCSYAQSYLPLTAGSGNALTNTLYINNSYSTGVGLQLDGTAYGGHIWQFGDGITTNGTFSIKDATTGLERLAITSSGNVGIGTISPSDLLQVNNGSTMRFQVASAQGVWVNNEVNGGTSSSPGPLYLNYSSTGNTLLNSNGGNVGIGTTSPTFKLEVSGNFKTTSGTHTNFLATGAGSGDGLVEMNNVSDVETIQLYTNGTSYFNGGNLLIGKTTQTNTGYKLDVNGSARANEIVVNTTGADFVFDNKYTLPKLSEVKSYIDVNHHLPEIPSAEQMTKDGMNVGELNTKLLQKVEELTLYLIDQQKQIDQLKQQLSNLTKN